MRELIILELPTDITKILNITDAPTILKRHLRLVYSTCSHLIDKLENEFPNLKISKNETLFGAGTHDIGKAIITNELYGNGNEHEETGYAILLENGISDNYARFAKTHGNWLDTNLKIEDLIVSLSDKIWKGKRINELEEHITEKIAKQLDIDYWDTLIKLDKVISDIVIGADRRLLWQNQP